MSQCRLAQDELAHVAQLFGQESSEYRAVSQQMRRIGMAEAVRVNGRIPAHVRSVKLHDARDPASRQAGRRGTKTRRRSVSTTSPF